MISSIEKIGIVGLGVMGGSLLLQLKKSDFKGSIYTVSRSEESKQWGMNNGADAAFASVKDLPEDLDLIVLAVVSSALKTVAKDIASCNFDNVFITDLASTKSDVIPNLEQSLGQLPYLSCHPMCGSEKTGNCGAKEDLYKNKIVILTPHNEQAQDLIEPLQVFWENLSAKTMVLNPREHDLSVAWVSHMPHLVIAALVRAISQGENDNPKLFNVAGTGLRDISRLAASNPSLWTEIVLENLEPVKHAVQGMQNELNALSSLLDNIDNGKSQELEKYFEVARNLYQEKGLGQI